VGLLLLLPLLVVVLVLLGALYKKGLQFVYSDEKFGNLAVWDNDNARYLNDTEGFGAFEELTLDRSRWTCEGYVRTKKIPDTFPGWQQEHEELTRPDWFWWTEEEWRAGKMPLQEKLLKTKLKRKRLEQVAWHKRFTKTVNYSKSIAGISKLHACPVHGLILDIHCNDTTRGEYRFSWFCPRKKCSYRYYISNPDNRTTMSFGWQQMPTGVPEDHRAHLRWNEGVAARHPFVYDMDLENDNKPFHKVKCPECKVVRKMLKTIISRAPDPGHIEYYKCMECGHFFHKVNKKSYY